MPLPSLCRTALLASLLLPAAAQVPGPVKPPVRFVENRGQWNDEVQFAILGACNGWVHSDGWTVRFERRSPAPRGAASVRRASGAVVRTRFRGGAGQGEGTDALPGVSNFLLGQDPARWVKGVPGHARLSLRGLRPGVDAVLRPLPGAGACFEYDLHLAASADLDGLIADLEGIDRLELTAAGALRASVRLCDGAMLHLEQRPPVAWVDGPGGRRPVQVGFRLLGPRRFGFTASDWQGNEALCIDPGVLWSTLLGGGSSDSVNDVKWQPGAGIALGGWAGSTDFPTTTGAFDVQGGQDGYVALMSEDGTGLHFATYLGGSRLEEVRGVAFGPGNSIAAVGFTTSPDFPVTAGALQPAYGGASFILEFGDAFVVRFDATGSNLIGSTYLGAPLDDVAESVAVDASGNAVVAGWTSSPGFPTTPGVFQPQLGGPVTLQPDGFVARVSADARTLQWSTYIGGGLPDQLFGVRLDSQGRPTVVGNSVSSNFPTTIGAYHTGSLGASEAVIARLRADGTGLVWSTFLGGTGNDTGLGLAVLPDDSVLLCGNTDSPNFPTTAGAPQRILAGGLDGYVSRLQHDGSNLLWSTYLGGASDDIARAVAQGPNGAPFVVGNTMGAFPVTTGAPQPNHGGGTLDGFATWYDAGLGSIAFSTYFGGIHDEMLNAVALPSTGLVAIGGWTWSADWPATAGSRQTTLRGVEDGTVTVLDLLTDLDGGLRISGPEAFTADIFQPDTEVRALAIELRNDTVRMVRLDSLRVFVGGNGSNRDLASLSLWRDPEGTGTGANLALLSGPQPAPADNSEVIFPVPGLLIAPGARTVLVVTFRTVAGCPAGAEYQCSVVAYDAWNVTALGLGTGPRLSLFGLPGVFGPSFACRERIGFNGDDDGDGLLSVVDLRRLVGRVGGPVFRADPDGDGVITMADLDLLRARLLGRPVTTHIPPELIRDTFATIRGFGLDSASPTATLAGRVLVRAAASDGELSFRIDRDLPLGNHQLRVMLGQRVLLLRTIPVQ